MRIARLWIAALRSSNVNIHQSSVHYTLGVTKGDVSSGGMYVVPTPVMWVVPEQKYGYWSLSSISFVKINSKMSVTI